MRYFVSLVLPAFLLGATASDLPQVGPVAPCADTASLVPPVQRERTFAKWTFWEECETFVGPVTASFVVTADGDVADPLLLRSSGCVAADREFTCRLKQRKYEPAQCEGRKIAYRTTLTVHWHPSAGGAPASPCIEEPPKERDSQNTEPSTDPPG